MRNFNNTNGCSSLIRRNGKKLLNTTAMTAAGLLALSGNAEAADDWTDHVATSGGSIAIDTSIPDTTNITQTGYRVTVSGDGDIKAGWTVNVAQQSSSSQYILFDTEADPTFIRGNLNANGEIFIFNQNGVIFGSDSVVDVGSIVASTAGTFLQTVDGDDETNVFTNFGDGEIINRGEITVAQAGLAAFVGPHVSNSGVINARLGNVVMAAGETVTLDMYGDGLVEVAVNGELADGLIKNTGNINAQGGNVLVSAAVAKDAVDNVINMDGVTTVSSAVQKGGKIILSGGESGRVNVKGALNANGVGGQDAGEIDISGENIRVTSSGRVRANAQPGGEAGNIDVIADNQLIVNGRISAQGLAGTGFIETSAPTTLFGAGASVLATREWLLDPTDVDINAGSVLETLIEAQLGAGNMTVQTPAAGGDAGNIALRTIINWSTANTFKLIGHNDVFLSAAGGGILSTGLGNFVVEAGDDFRMNAGNAGIFMNGGNVHITAADEFTLDGSAILAGGGNILINNGESFAALANSIGTSGTGTIEINQNKDANGQFTIATPTIQNAIDAITNTGTGTNTINVGAGTWAESVNVDHDNIVLNGANAGLHGSDGARGPESIVTPNSPGFYVTADNAVIDGFTVDGSGASGNNGIEADGVNNFTARNNILMNNTDTAGGRSASDWTTGIGVLVQDSTGNINIEDNLSKDNTDGIRVYNTNAAALGDILIKGNDVTDNGDKGIITKNSDNIQISGNTIEGNKTGVWLENSDGNLVNNNDINNTTENAIRLRNGSDNGVLRNNRIDGAGHNGVKLDGSDNTTIRGNRILNVDQNGIDNRDSHGTDIIDNIIRFAGLNGVYINPSDNIRVIGNTITDVTEDGVHSEEGNDIRVRNNTIRRIGDDGVDITRNDYVRVTGNTVTDTDRRGISVERSNNESETSVVVADNTVRRTGRTGIVVDRFTTARVVDNTVTDSNRAGIRVQRGDEARIRRNTIRDTRRDGIKAVNLDTVDIRRNLIRRAGWDGIHLEDFGSAWIAYNDIKWTGDDGVDVSDGGFVSIYNNYIDLSGFLPAEFFGNEEVGEDANGIYVENVTGGDVPEGAEEGFGYSYYGADVEIHGNDVANSEDDGVQVKGDNDGESAYIANNLIGHVGDDGVDVNDVDHTVAKDNIITLAGDAGITIRSGEYAGVFDNRILLTGTDGIRVHDVNGHGSEVLHFLGDDEYGYGWSVNVSGNEVAFTGEDGIHVGDSGATKITRNNIFAAGLGEGLEEVIDFVNDLANGTFIPFAAFAAPSTESILSGFSWEWGNGHGIAVHDIEGAYYSPNGWAADIRNNNVKWTGGHGILAEDSDRTRIKNNRVKYSGIDEVYFGGTTSMASAFTTGPFAEEGRRDLWRSEGHDMADILEDFFGVEDPEDPEYGDYITITDIEFDSHDGIHAENIYGQSLDGLSGRPYLYDLKIKGNTVRITGDDGIEVDGAGRTLIAENTIRDSGHGDDEDYGSGDHYGADGIFVRNVSTDIYDEIYYPTVSGLDEEEEGYNYERPRNYALIIRNNDVRRTADDGIEVVGGERPLPRVRTTGEGTDDIYFFGTTDRVLIAENTVRRTGDNAYDDDSRLGPDGYGHDGIHVRGIFGDIFDGPVWATDAGPGAGPSGEGPGGFYGYAVDIIGNDVRRTGDDGIEVINSRSTLIYDNTVRNAGIGGGYDYGSGDYYGADGIHVRNVGGFFEGPIWAPGSAGESGISFQPYSVAIAGNDVRRTRDDGIEVVGEMFIGDGGDGCGDGDGFCGDGSTCVTGDGDGFPSFGTGRTLIADNLVRNAGFFDVEHVGDSVESVYYEGGAPDGYGADGIHVRGVQRNFFPPVWDEASTTSPGFSGGIGPYFGADVEIVGNDVKNVEDDGIEVIARKSPFYRSVFGGGTNILIDNNHVENSGDDGIRILAEGGFLFPDTAEEAPSVYFYGPNPINSVVSNNTVINSGNDALHIAGPAHDHVEVFGNTFTDFDIGAHFESGLIDLTGEGNLFENGRVGMRFAPAIVGYSYGDTPTVLPPSEPIYAPLALVDDDGPGGFGGTIGAQTFDGQSQYYVELDNGAFFEPGTPTLLNALDSTYVGTPFGTVTPSVDFPAGFTLEQLAFFENRFYHFNDDGTLGLFFFPLLPNIDQEDIFNYFGPNAGDLAGLNVTILGLPGIPGNPVALNNIAPFAGGDLTPEQLNNIATAAGGDGEGGSSASCFGDAAGAEGPVTVSFEGGAEGLLNSEVGCGS